MVWHRAANDRDGVKVVAASVLALVLAARSAPSQTSASVAAEDSAGVARAAWNRALDAIRRRDLVSARHEVDHAAAAWPVQETYVWYSALLASRASDTAAVISALRRYADLGLGRDVLSDTGLAKLVALPAIADVRRHLDANRAPLARGRVYATMPDTAFWPEGMDVDTASGRVFVTSMRYGTIAEVSANGRVREIMPRGAPNVGSMFGVRFDAQRSVLWATTSGTPNAERYTPADSGIAALLEVRPSDGVILRRFDLAPIPGGHILGDLAIGPSGDVYVTDSNEPVLYRLRPGAAKLEPLRDPLFHSLQGVAPTPDGRALIVADYSHGLLRVDLATNSVVRLADAPGSTSLGCDGLVWARDGVIAVQNGVAPPRVARFQLDVALSRVQSVKVLDRNPAVADEPTIGALLRGEFLYVANGQWDKHAPDGTRLPGAQLRPPVILAVSVGR